MTRRPEGTRISVRIPDDVIGKIDVAAATQGVSRAAIIRQLLQEALK